MRRETPGTGNFTLVTGTQPTEWGRSLARQSHRGQTWLLDALCAQLDAVYHTWDHSSLTPESYTVCVQSRPAPPSTGPQLRSHIPPTVTSTETGLHERAILGSDFQGWTLCPLLDSHPLEPIAVSFPCQVVSHLQ